MRPVKQGLCTLVLTLAVIMLTGGVAYAAPLLPQSFYGTVTATEGTVNGGQIEAVLDGQSFTIDFEGTTFGGSGKATDHTLDVSGENIKHVITFKVNGVEANESTEYIPGEITCFNLTVKGTSNPGVSLTSIIAEANSSSSVDLTVNEKVPIVVTAVYSDNTKRNVTAESSFSSSNDSVAKVADGQIAGLKVGTAAITVAYGGKTASIAVEVYKTGGGNPGGNGGGALNLPGAGVPAVLTFTDIADCWAKANIEKLVQLGIAAGYPDKTFRPGNPITRGETVTMLIKAAGLSPATDCSNLKAFKDYPQMEEWVKPYASAAVQAGIIKGYANGNLQLSRRVNRIELFAMLARMLKTTETAQINFTDKDQIPVWGLEPLGRLLAQHLVSGYPDGTIRPSRTATRAEVAAMLALYLDNK